MDQVSCIEAEKKVMAPVFYAVFMIKIIFRCKFYKENLDLGLRPFKMQNF